MKNLEQKRIEVLYEILEQEKDEDKKTVLQWAIFELEKIYGEKE